jgi:hypothetical protein
MMNSSNPGFTAFYPGYFPTLLQPLSRRVSIILLEVQDTRQRIRNHIDNYPELKHSSEHEVRQIPHVVDQPHDQLATGASPGFRSAPSCSSQKLKRLCKPLLWMARP